MEIKVSEDFNNRLEFLEEICNVDKSEIFRLAISLFSESVKATQRDEELAFIKNGEIEAYISLGPSLENAAKHTRKLETFLQYTSQKNL